MTILLNQRRGDLDIVNQLADLAVRDYSGHAVLQSLFALCSDRTSITEDLLINAAGKSTDMLKFLVEHASHEVKSIESLIQSATRSKEEFLGLKSWLERTKSNFKITEDTLVSVLSGFNGPELLQLLL